MVAVGDSVRLRYGISRIEVTKVTDYTFDGFYPDSTNPHRFKKRPLADAVPFTQQEQPTMTKLYKTTTGLYGEFLTKDASQIVLKMAGTGEYIAFDPETLAPVRPYTIRIRFAAGASDFEIKEGTLKKSDIVYWTKNGIGQVVEIDTKVEGAQVYPVDQFQKMVVSA